MKKLLFLFMMPFAVFAQTDTIYTNGEKISATVKEITEDGIKFSYPNEELLNTVYKNTVQKIVFKSGRVQQFTQSSNLKPVNGATDFESVSLTSIRTEINGLTNLGEISAKAQSTTVLGGIQTIKDRAYSKLKIVAAMLGANIVYLNQSTTTTNQAYNPTATIVSGIAYTNRLPDYDAFTKLIGDKKSFKSTTEYKLGQSSPDMAQSNYFKNLDISRLYNDNGLIMIEAKLGGVSNTLFRVISFNEEYKTFQIGYKDGSTYYNYRISTE